MASSRLRRGRAGDRGGVSRAETGAACLSVAARNPPNGAQAKRGVPRAPRRLRGAGGSRRARGDPPGLSGEARARLMAGRGPASRISAPLIVGRRFFGAAPAGGRPQPSSRGRHPPLNSDLLSPRLAADIRRSTRTTGLVRGAVGFRGRIGAVAAHDDQLHLLAYGLAVDLRARQRLGQPVAHEEDFLSGVPHDLIAWLLPVRQEPEFARGGGFEAQADVGIVYVRRGLDLGQHPQRACRHTNHHALLFFAARRARVTVPLPPPRRVAGAPSLGRARRVHVRTTAAEPWVSGPAGKPWSPVWVAMFLPSRTSYDALTSAPSDTSMSVPCRPSTWTRVSVVTESVLLIRPNQPVATRTVPSVRSTFLTVPSTEPAAGASG